MKEPSDQERQIIADCQIIIQIQPTRQAKAEVRHELAAFLMPDKPKQQGYVRVYEWLDSNKKHPRPAVIEKMGKWIASKVASMTAGEKMHFMETRKAYGVNAERSGGTSADVTGSEL